MKNSFTVEPIGRVAAGYASRAEAPRQGRLKSARSIIEIEPRYLAGLEGLKPGRWLWILFWFDRAERDRLKVHPRGDMSQPLSGVFATRSPARPNPIALDLGLLEAIEGPRLTFSGLDALEGTPVLDIKPYLADFDRPNERPGED